MGTTEQSPDKIFSGAEHDSSCPHSDYYPKSMEGTMSAAETAAQGVPCPPSAAASVMLRTVQQQGLRAVLLEVFQAFFSFCKQAWPTLLWGSPVKLVTQPV